jgi:hypothetical protein
MTGLLRYGVFQVDHIWKLVGDDGAESCYSSRDSALTAARAMRSLHQAFGAEVEILSINDGLELERDVDSSR